MYKEDKRANVFRFTPFCRMYSLLFVTNWLCISMINKKPNSIFFAKSGIQRVGFINDLEVL